MFGTVLEPPRGRGVCSRRDSACLDPGVGVGRGVRRTTGIIYASVMASRAKVHMPMPYHKLADNIGLSSCLHANVVYNCNGLC